MPSINEALDSVNKLKDYDFSKIPCPGKATGGLPVSFGYSSIKQLDFADDQVYAPPSNVLQYFRKETLYMGTMVILHVTIICFF